MLVLQDSTLQFFLLNNLKRTDYKFAQARSLKNDSIHKVLISL